MSGSLGQMAIKFAPMLAALAAAPFTGGATAALTPYLGAAGAGATAASLPGLASGLTGGILGATGAGQPKTPNLASLVPPPTTATGLPSVAGGAPEAPGSGLTPNVPSAGPSTGQSYDVAGMGNNVAQNLFGPQNPFYQYAAAA
jgi:hypothetical protein